MNEQNRKQIIIAAVLGVALAGVLFYQFVIAGGAPPAPAASGTEQQAAGQQQDPAAKRTQRTQARDSKGAATAPLESISLEEIKAMTDNIGVRPIDYSRERIARNPMAPLVGTLASSAPGGEGVGEEEGTVVKRVVVDTISTKKINGIVYDSRFPVAVVDDTVVHIGYVFPNGAQVHAIEPTRVLFKVGETIIPVEMKEH